MTGQVSVNLAAVWHCRLGGMCSFVGGSCGKAHFHVVKLVEARHVGLWVGSIEVRHLGVCRA